MKKREWNEEQLQQLLQQLPSVRDKQSKKELYQNIYYKNQNKKKRQIWVAPTVATIAVLFILALTSPLLYQSITSTNEENAMDMASTSSSGSTKAENKSGQEIQMAESSLAEDRDNENVENSRKEIEQETFVTDADNSENIITVGLTDESLQNIIPVSFKEEAGKEELDQIETFNPDKFAEKLGPLRIALTNTDLEEENNDEIIINYKSDNGSITGSGSEVAYKESIIETFRWLGYKKANLFTNGVEGIEFSNYGQEEELEITETRNKAYLVYQYDESKAKLLVPSPESLPTIEEAIDIMKKGIDEQELKPSIQEHIGEIIIKEDGERLEIDFTQNANVENNEESIIMLESILLTAKDFGYETVQFKGTKEKEIGLMDVSRPLEVPFSPNPIDEND
ncbi:hypothetical protein [Metabacillus halosaccharovorans]|uniref:GerMN domain-containing protein n=1 Tax=Metabacillus halosaccharovorans TaxID=930124 RepID=A0ABT3DN22_9BACI|nr:hypothetical protein [Metabacillus halosaccharovorans]MCV9888309.1 hypothetical protein [Metabacillus halosaccharovorans]